jgi:hypothetical protein
VKAIDGGDGGADEGRRELRSNSMWKPLLLSSSPWSTVVVAAGCGSGLLGCWALSKVRRRLARAALGECALEAALTSTISSSSCRRVRALDVSVVGVVLASEKKLVVMFGVTAFLNT